MHRIRLGNTVFEGRNNAYLLGTDPGATTTLVDTGVATPDVRDQLERGLENHGVSVDDVERILLTHWHEDHVGLAGAIQAESGATVRAHPADRPLIERGSDATEELHGLYADRFEAWGMPRAAREELLAFLEGNDGLAGTAPTVEPIEAGERVEAGDRTLEAVHLPGHTDGLLGFRTAAGAELFTGDALLPHYTPNVGGADIRVERPLAKYLDTLVRIVEFGLERAWPGHREPIAEPAERAREIFAHHRERTERVVEILAEHGPADAWTVSAHLFGDLESIHILHGPGEAAAHLEHLRDHGVVDRTDGRYALAGDPPADLFPDLP